LVYFNNLTTAPAGFTLEEATAINASGQIVGYGTYGSNSNGVEHAFLLTPEYHPGDANGDGRVDINDLTIVLANYNQTGLGWAEGEFTGDGTVDINDLTIVLNNYGWSGGYSSTLKSVPEPASLLLLLSAAASLFLFLRRRRLRAAA
jgi:probable HAF family extracellular repeat protein